MLPDVSTIAYEGQRGFSPLIDFKVIWSAKPYDGLGKDGYYFLSGIRFQRSNVPGVFGDGKFKDASPWVYLKAAESGLERGLPSFQ